MIGDIVFARFPLADREAFKERPCLVISRADERGDLAVLKITSRDLERTGRRLLRTEDFLKGSLPKPSAVVLHDETKIHLGIVSRYVGRLKDETVGEFLKARLLSGTRRFSRLAHAANRPGDDPLHPHNDTSSAIRHSPSTPVVPYAGRVFNEDEVEAAVSATLDFWLTLGSEGAAMERELADFLGVKHSLLVNSGSSANLVALSALTTHKLPKHKRIQPGDEVITVAAGFPTTVAPIIQVGAEPVFIDADPVTGNAVCSQLEAAYAPGKTKAVMMAHALGNPFDLAATLAFCKKYDLWLIEDNCDALGCTYSLPVDLAKSIGLDHLVKIAEKGEHSIIRISIDSNTKRELLTAPTGTFGDLSTQSFYPPHHLTMGEGGAVNIIRRAPLKTYAESFRDWGRDCWCPSGKDNTCGKRFGWQLGELPEGYDHKYIYSHLGFNLKPLDTQAAIGRVQLRRLPAFIQARKDNWEYLRRGLADLEDVFEFALPTHATAWQPPLGDADDLTSAFTWDQSGIRSDCSWFGFKMTVREGALFSRTDFARFLDENKIGNRMLFGGNLLRQPAFVQLRKDRPEGIRILDFSGSSLRSASAIKGGYPGADRIMNDTVFLGTYPGLSRLQLDYMVERIQAFVHGASEH